MRFAFPQAAYPICVNVTYINKLGRGPFEPGQDAISERIIRFGASRYRRITENTIQAQYNSIPKNATSLFNLTHTNSQRGTTMAFIENIIQKAQANPKTVILPEPEDPRTLKAALEIEEKFTLNIQ